MPVKTPILSYETLIRKWIKENNIENINMMFTYKTKEMEYFLQRDSRELMSYCNEIKDPILTLSLAKFYTEHELDSISGLTGVTQEVVEMLINDRGSINYDEEFIMIELLNNKSLLF